MNENSDGLDGLYCNFKSFVMKNNIKYYPQEVFQKFVDEMIHNGKIIEKEIEKTEYFMEEMLPNIIELILSRTCSIDEGKYLNSYILQLIPLFVKTISNVNSNFITAMHTVFTNQQAQFYKSTSISHTGKFRTTYEPSIFYTINTTELVKSNYFTEMLHIFHENDYIHPQFFQNSLCLVLNLEKYIAEAIFKDFAHIIAVKYINIIDSMQDETINGLDLQTIRTNMLFISASLEPGTLRHQISYGNSKIAIAFAKSSNTSIQLQGLKCICDDVSNIGSFDLCEQINKSNLVPELIPKLTPCIASIFAQILLAMAQEKSLEIKDLKAFWRFSATKEDPEYFEAWTSLFVSLPQAMRSEFWKFVPKTKQFSIPCIRFLDSICEYPNKDEATKMIMTLESQYEIFDDKESAAIVRATICNFIPNDKKVCSLVQKSCIAMLDEEQKAELGLAMMQASVMKGSGGKLVPFFTKIISIITDLNPNQYVSLIKGILALFKSPLNDQEFKAFINLIEKMFHNNKKEMCSLIESLLAPKFIRAFPAEIKLRIFEELCHMKPEDNDTVNIIIKIFETINIVSMVADSSSPGGYMIADNAKSLQGVASLWQLAFRQKTLGATNYLIQLFSRSRTPSNISAYIKACLKYISKRRAALRAIIKLIRYVELQHAIDLLGIKKNKYISIDNYCTVFVQGIFNDKLKLIKTMTLKAFKEHISILTRTPANRISVSSNGEFLDESTFEITEGCRFEAKVWGGMDKYTEPSTKYFPTTILTSRNTSKPIMDMMLANDPSAILAFEILNELPTDKTQLNIILEGSDYSSLFDARNPALLLYRLHTFASIINSEYETHKLWTNRFFANGGPKVILQSVLIEAFDTFQKYQNIAKSACSVTCFILSKASELISLQNTIEKFPDEYVTNYIKWCNNEFKDDYKDTQFFSESIKIISFFAKYKRNTIIGSKKFYKLFQCAIFHPDQKVRKAIYETIKIIDPLVIEKQLIRLLESSNNPYCNYYFRLINKIVEKTDNTSKIFKCIETIMYSAFCSSSNDNEFEELQFEQPHTSFSHGIFSVLGKLAERDGLEIADEENFFQFVLYYILFHPLKYYNPTPGIFKFLLNMITKNSDLFGSLTVYLEMLAGSFDSDVVSGLEIDPEAKRRGLLNLGNTDYINVILQQLYNIPEFTKSILESPMDSPEWLGTLMAVIAQMRYYPTNFVDPSMFIQQMTINGEAINPKVQKDPITFLSALFYKFQQICPDILNLFKGTIMNEVRGVSEPYHTESKIPFTVFELDTLFCHSIDEALQNFLEPDHFEGANMYETETKEKITANCFHYIKEAPKIMIFRLNRFEVISPKNGEEYIIKHNTAFRFPHQFDISIAMREPQGPVMYDLIGVTMHNGTFNDGHFYSLCGKDGKWLELDDIHVSDFDKVADLPNIAAGGNDNLSSRSETNEKRNNAYILFYRRRGEIDESNPNIEEPIINAMIEDVKAVVLRKVLANSLYMKFITDIAKESKDPEIVYRCLIQAHRRASSDAERLGIITKLQEAAANSNVIYSMMIEERELYEEILSDVLDPNVRISCAHLISNAIKHTKNAKPYLEFVEKTLPKSVEHYEAYGAFLLPLKELVEAGSIDNEKWLAFLMNFITLKVSDALKSNPRQFLKKMDISPVIEVIVTIIRKSVKLMDEFRGTFTSHDFCGEVLRSTANIPAVVMLWDLYGGGSKEKILEIHGKLSAWKDPTGCELAAILCYGIKTIDVSNKLCKWVMNSVGKTPMLMYDFFEHISILAQFTDIDIGLALMEYAQFIIVNWLFTSDEIARAGVRDMIYNVYYYFPRLDQYNVSLSSKAKEKTSQMNVLATALINELPRMVDIVSSKDSKKSLGPTPIDVYFELLKWAVKYGRCTNAIIAESSKFINALQKFNELDYVGISASTFLLRFLTDVIGEQYNKEFFAKQGSYQRFLMTISTSIFKENNIAAVTVRIKAIISLTPASEFPRFVKSQFFQDSIKYGMAGIFSTSNEYKRFLIESVSNETLKTMRKTIFNNSTFTYNTNHENSCFFELGAELIQKFKQVGEQARKGGFAEVIIKRLENSPKLRPIPAHIRLLAAIITAVREGGAGKDNKNSIPDMLTLVISHKGALSDIIGDAFAGSLKNDLACAVCELCSSLVILSSISRKIVVNNMNEGFAVGRHEETRSEAIRVLEMLSFMAIQSNNVESHMQLARSLLRVIHKEADTPAINCVCYTLHKILKQRTQELRSIIPDVSEFFLKELRKPNRVHYFTNGVRQLIIDVISIDPTTFEPLTSLCVYILREIVVQYAAAVPQAGLELIGALKFLNSAARVSNRMLKGLPISGDEIEAIQRTADQIGDEKYGPKISSLTRMIRSLQC